AQRWLSTRGCASTQGLRSISAIRKARGSAARTRTPTDCFVSISRRAQTSASTALTILPQWPLRLMEDHERLSTGGLQPKLSTIDYDLLKTTALRRSLEPTLRAAIAVMHQRADAAMGRS